VRFDSFANWIGLGFVGFSGKVTRVSQVGIEKRIECKQKTKSDDFASSDRLQLAYQINHRITLSSLGKTTDLSTRK
jgi:hypothetical protein